MTSGWITVSNKAYSNLAGVLCSGLELFSRHEFKVFEIDIGEPNGAALSKLKCLADSPYDYTVFLDADTVPSRAIDDLISICVECDSETPILQRHIYAREIPSRIQSHFGIGVYSLPYCQSNVILVSPRARRWVDRKKSIIESGNFIFSGEIKSYDEVYLNAALRSERDVRFISYCTPRADGYFRWRRGDGESIYPGHYFTFHAWHNIKNWPMAQELLDDLTHSDPELEIGRIRVF